MSLFNAPAWMMKGGGGSPSNILSIGDDDPYKYGKTKVDCEIENAKITISSDKTQFVLSFVIKKNAFTSEAEKVKIWLELPIAGHWRYIVINQTADFQRDGVRKIINISDAINRNGSAKKALLETKKLYLLFQTSQEIIKDQVKAEIVKQ